MFLFLPSSLLPQEKLSDQIYDLEKKLLHAQDKEKIAIYYELARIYKDIQPLKGIEYAEKGLEIAQKNKDKTTEAKLLIALGGNYSLLSNFQVSMQKYYDALKIARHLDNPEIVASALNYIGLNYYWQAKYEKSLEFFMKSIAIREKLDDKTQFANSLNNMGLVEYKQKNYSTAIGNFRKSIEIKQKYKDFAGIVRSRTNLSLCFMESGKFQEAFYELDKALALSKKIGYNGGVILCYGCLGNIYTLQGNYEKALSYYNTILKIPGVSRSLYAVSDIYYSIGMIYKKKSDYETALKYLLQSTENARKINSRNHYPDIFRELSEIYQKKGELENALDYKDSLIAAQDTLMKNEKNQALIEEHAVFLISEKDKELRNREEQIENQRMFIIYTMAGIAILFIVIFSIVAVHRKKEKILKELNITKALIETAFQQTPIPMLLLRYPDFVIQYGNNALKELLKIPVETNHIGKKPADVPVDWKVYDSSGKQITSGVLAGGSYSTYEEVKNEEYTICRKDGSKKQCLVNIVPIKNDKGMQIAIFEVILDITQIKEAEEKLIEYTHELKKLNITKDKFFNVIAHDLKSPFQGLLGFSQILAENALALSKEELLRISADLNNAIKNQFRFLEDLLLWSRIQSGSMELSLTENILYEEVENVFVLLKNNAIMKNIELINNTDKNTKLTTDKEMLKLVIRNLVTNAIKFSHPNSTVTVKAAETTEDVTVCVEDTGVGIKKQNIEKILSKDITYTTNGTNNEKGTGLGLSLCREVVEKHNGKIWIESEQEKGSRFYFSIPK